MAYANEVVACLLGRLLSTTGGARLGFYVCATQELRDFSAPSRQIDP
jgi:hypothetical protein